ncbi:MAG: hypothetical protein ACOX8E_03880 [Ruminococcus sp.]|jgi:hypothetical protein
MIKIMDRFLNWQSSSNPVIKKIGQAGMRLISFYAKRCEMENADCKGDEKIMLEAKEKIREKILREIKAR